MQEQGKTLDLFLANLTSVKLIDKFMNEHYEEEEIQMRHAQGEPWLGDPKLTSLSFDLC